MLLSGNPTVYTVNLTTDNGPTSAGTGSGDTGDLRYVINLANADPNLAGSMIEFDPMVFATAKTITLSPTLGTLALSESAGPEMIDGPGGGLVTVSGGSTVGVLSVASGVTASIAGLTITGGLTASNGGGIDNSGTLTLANDVFNNDGAVYYGGAVYNETGGTLTVTNTTFSNDLANYGLGGAIDNAGTLTVTGSTFTKGNAFEGGGIDNKSGGLLSVTDSTFADNTAIQGGAIFNDATATITGSTINNNSAFQGGGLANDLVGTLTLINSTIAGNYAGQNGGGINQVGTLLSINNTIADNDVAAGGSGGGVECLLRDGDPRQHDHRAELEWYRHSATPSDIAGTVSSVSANNLIGTGSGGLTNGTNGNLVGVTNPDLGTLADNGGPTQTIALLKGSPAIDAGSNALAVDPQGNPLTTDQRGTSYLFTGILMSGSASVTGISSTTGLVAGQTVTGPTTIFTGTLTSGSASVTDISSTTGLVAGQIITGTNIPSGTTIQTVNSSTNTITLSVNATVSGSQSLTATDIPSGTTIQAVNSSMGTITLSADATVSGSQSLTASSYPRIVNKVVDIGAFEAGTTSVYTVDLTSDTARVPARTRATCSTASPRPMPTRTRPAA